MSEYSSIDAIGWNDPTVLNTGQAANSGYKNLVNQGGQPLQQQNQQARSATLGNTKTTSQQFGAGFAKMFHKNVSFLGRK